MPRVNLPHTQITRAGVAPGAEVNGDATNDHETANDGQVTIRVRNAGATPRVVEFVVSRVVDGQQPPPKTKTVAAGEIFDFGPFPPVDYGSLLLINVDHADLKLTATHH